MLNSPCEIILYVSDMESQVRFYRDVLGFRVSYPTDFGNYANEYWVTFETGNCTLTLHGGGSKEFGKDAPRLVFTVDDITGVRTALIARGMHIGEIRSPAGGIEVADCRDPEGNVFSIERRSHDVTSSAS